MLAKMGTNGVLTGRPSICEPRRLPRGGRGPKMANRPGVIGPILRQSGAGLAALRRPAISPLCFPMGAALHDAFPKCRYQRPPHPTMPIDVEVRGPEMSVSGHSYHFFVLLAPSDVLDALPSPLP